MPPQDKRRSTPVNGTRLVGSVFALFLVLCIPQSVFATAIAFSEINFSNLRIIPANGTVQFQGSWVSDAFAQASNSLGQRAQQFDPKVADVARANAMVTYASGN